MTLDFMVTQPLLGLVTQPLLGLAAPFPCPAHSPRSRRRGQFTQTAHDAPRCGPFVDLVKPAWEAARRMGASRISRRTETEVSAWLRLVAKDVRFTPASATETYHCLAQADYVAIVARLPDGRLPIVRQFRPAVECDTWELPAGLLEPNEGAEQAARRELLEETGATPLSVLPLGTFYADTGRLENRIHILAAEAALPPPDFVAEPGMSAALVSPSELRAMILAGEFNHQLHVGALALAELNGFRTGVFA